ncbi:MAG TPA: hypothetical protein VGO47_06180 [Chlamydiales bacterium]|nr:hypothetical protein [Chlamydiales bacterium]
MPEAHARSFIEYGDVPPTLKGISSGLGMEYAPFHPHSTAAASSVSYDHSRPVYHPTTNGAM